MTRYNLEKTDYIRAFMTERPVNLERAALVVVDMQYATGARDGALGRRLQSQGSNVADYRFDRIEQFVVPNIRRMLDAFHGSNGAVVYLTIGAKQRDASDAPPHMRKFFQELENYEGSREHEIIDELKPLPGDVVINKTSVGAFASTGIDSVLRAMQRDQLYMVGVSTNMCVDTTAREAADRGYAVTMVDDACGTTRSEFHDMTMNSFQRLFGRVVTVQEALEELGLDDAN
jgi:nicotinamidase-related amidase